MLLFFAQFLVFLFNAFALKHGNYEIGKRLIKKAEAKWEQRNSFLEISKRELDQITHIKQNVIMHVATIYCKTWFALHNNLIFIIT